jgi:carbamoyl-phosphate synthase large subunit
MMTTILITGVGAIIGYGLAQSARLSDRKIHVIGSDIYEDAVGKEWCDTFIQAMPTASNGFPEYIRTVVANHNVDMIIPGIEQDVIRFASEPIIPSGSNTRLVLNSPSLIQIATDKWLTHEALTMAGHRAIETLIDVDYRTAAKALGSPFLLKPRKSYASKGIQVIADERDWDYWHEKTVGSLMYQRIIGTAEDEFTVGAFGYGDGTSTHILMFRRRLAADGSTVKAVVVDDRALLRCVCEHIELFKPLGPTNLQFRRTNGEYFLLEVNPRVSSSHSLRTAFGINDIDLCLQYYIDGVKPRATVVRAGRAIRYIRDHVTYCDNL